ncbi:hypothetical protein GCM10020000_69700 [Streptomyces olivoverticillatus]
MLRGAFGDQVDPPGLDEAEDQQVGAEVLDGLGILEEVDDVLDGAGVGQGGGDRLHDAGLVAALLVGFRPDRTAELFGGVADDADDAVRAALRIAPDAALRVRPAGGAVTGADTVVDAVGLAAVLEGLGDQAVGAGRVLRREPPGDVLDAVYGRAGRHAEDFLRHGVQVQPVAVDVPVEAADAIEGETQLGASRPVVRRRCVGGRRSPINHRSTLPLFLSVSSM